MGFTNQKRMLDSFAETSRYYSPIILIQGIRFGKNFNKNNYVKSL